MCIRDRPYTEVNGNKPYFTAVDLTTQSFATSRELDSLGRCGVAYANVGQDLMPTEPRGEIGAVKPTGWHLVKYDNVDGKYLYNRCHLIAYMLAAENANPQNLITGTRYLNVQGMLPFETKVCDYVKNTGNHVLYRVTPIFDGDNLLADGVLMEAYSVEDAGEGICFFVFAVSYTHLDVYKRQGYTYSELNQTMYAKSAVNVRDLPSTDGKKIGSLKASQEITVTGKYDQTGWYRFDLNLSLIHI